MSKRADDVRKEILLQLYAVRPLALTVERIQRDAMKSGYDYSVGEIKSEAQFLVDENLIARVDVPGTTAPAYRIHANGVRHYEQNYAA